MASETAADLTFGEAMEKLEEIVAQLEENEALGLEQSLALYEQGLALAGDCQQRLSAAKLRITELSVTSRSEEA
jgi:exodeoxyribonuclease VII small subunit